MYLVRNRAGEQVATSEDFAEVSPLAADSRDVTIWDTSRWATVGGFLPVTSERLAVSGLDYMPRAMHSDQQVTLAE